MRKKEYLFSPKVAIREYKVDDFKKITYYATNVVLSDKVCATDITFNFLCTMSGSLVKSYYVDNRFFMYSTNKRLYEYLNYRLVTALIDITKPLITDVVINGNKEILIIESTTAYILNKKITFTFPYGTCIAKYDGRLFVGDALNVYFSNVFNFTEYSTNIENAGFLSVNKEDGEILELVSFNDCMYVVCKNAIYKLKISSEGEFEFKKCEIDYLNILENSVKKIGKKIYFISQKKLCEFDGNSFKRINGDFDRFLGGATESATATKSFYSIKIMINETVNFLVYDTLTGNHHYIWNDGVGKIGENGYLFVSKFLTVYQIDYNKNMQVFSWYSNEIDFGTTKKKTLFEIRITADQPLPLMIEGDFGAKMLPLKQGENVIKLGLTSKRFKMSVSIESYTFEIGDMKFKYKIVGE